MKKHVLLLAVILFFTSCAGKYFSAGSDLDLVDSGSAGVATGLYLDRRFKNFFQKALGDNPRGVTASESAYLFENPTEVMEPQEIALLGAVDLLEAPRCKNNIKGDLWGQGVCSSTTQVRPLAGSRLTSPTQSYFSLVRRIAAPMCSRLVKLEMGSEPARNYLVKRTVDSLQDAEAPSAEDVSDTMTRMYGYGPSPLELHPGSQDIAEFMLEQMQAERTAKGSFTKEEATEFMSDLYKGVCLVLTHSPQMILQ